MSDDLTITGEGTAEVGGKINPASPMDQDEDQYDFDIPYDEELELALQSAESQTCYNTTTTNTTTIIDETQDGSVKSMSASIDIEDLPLGLNSPLEETERLSPFQQFRKKGYLSVSDLVGPLWCETQYDYRLRTLPFLPPSQRPDTIKSKDGNEIVVDKVKVEDKEKILKRGEKIHKRLEREIHPEEIKVPISTEEDIWGLRFLNMLAAMEALLVLGKCRELPVVGFIKGVLVYGIIDEITREPIPSSSTSDIDDSSTKKPAQTSLTSFFTSSKPKPDQTKTNIKPKTHRLYISDSKTRASNVLPNEEDTLSGRLQVMLYKELLDSILLSATNSTSSSQNGSSSSNVNSSILPSRNPFSWDFIFAHLDLNPNLTFSQGFLDQSKLVVLGNGLRFNADKAETLNDMKEIWNQYVLELGLGTSTNTASIPIKNRSKGKCKAKIEAQEDGNLGRTEDSLKLVYRKAGGKKKTKKERGDRRTKKRRTRATRNGNLDGNNDDEQGEPPPSSSLFLPHQDGQNDTNAVEEEEDRLVRLAIVESLKPISDGLETNGEAEEENHTDADGKLEFEIPRPPTRSSEHLYWGESDGDNDQDEKEDDELAWAVEMSLTNPDVGNFESENGLKDGQGIVNVIKTPKSSQQANNASSPKSSQSWHEIEEIPPESQTSQSKSTSNETTINKKSSSKSQNRDKESNDKSDEEEGNLPSGTIIGTHKFKHSPLLLAKHLDSVFQFWMGEREPIGVNLHQTKRCGWCEFEQNCEWRSKKAQEIWQSRQKLSSS
ncbi:uncharacterized protein L201_001395 [Kwoniella dendrophila CBS 6074]|uniref:Exonuclease V n=1 Tax=Kwoniella dendrophila CBS 6074 TaxID=1295534 RepID=A0AAX4JPX9_9TREE